MFVLNKRLESALVKKGFKVEQEKHTRRSYVREGRNIVSWSVQDEYAVNVLCTREDDQRDSRSDYFPGTYAKTIKYVINYLEGK